MSSDNQALSTAEAAFEDQRSSVGRTLHRFLHNNFTVVPAAILILSCLLFSLIVGSRFLHPFNFSLILQQATRTIFGPMSFREPMSTPPATAGATYSANSV